MDIIWIALFAGSSLLNAQERYLIPKDAGDWSAWGTWISAVGTIGAVIYAANQFRAGLKEPGIQGFSVSRSPACR